MAYRFTLSEDADLAEPSALTQYVSAAAAHMRGTADGSDVARVLEAARS